MQTRASTAGPSRRGFLAAALAVTTGLTAEGCADAGSPGAGHPTIPTRPPRTARVRRHDLRILDAALSMERRAIAAYAACIPLLDAGDVGWAKAFVGEESQQAGELAKLITLDGASAPVANGEPAIGHPRDGAQALTLLAALEREHVARYLAWIPQLSAGPVRAGVATILAADAQHLAALRGVLGLPAITSAFVLGPVRRA